MLSLHNAIWSPLSVAGPIVLTIPVGMCFSDVLHGFHFLPFPVIINCSDFSLNQICFYLGRFNALLSIRMQYRWSFYYCFYSVSNRMYKKIKLVRNLLLCCQFCWKICKYFSLHSTVKISIIFIFLANPTWWIVPLVTIKR